MTFHCPGPIAIASVVLGVIAAILPARCAARPKVIEALAGEQTPPSFLGDRA